jgi:hypothetical protein
MHHSFNFIRKFKLRLPNHTLYEYAMAWRRLSYQQSFARYRQSVHQQPEIVEKSAGGSSQLQG